MMSKYYNSMAVSIPSGQQQQNEWQVCFVVSRFATQFAMLNILFLFRFKMCITAVCSGKINVAHDTTSSSLDFFSRGQQIGQSQRWQRWQLQPLLLSNCPQTGARLAPAVAERDAGAVRPASAPSVESATSVKT